MTSLPADIEVLEPLSGAYRETHFRLPPRSAEAVKVIYRGSLGGAAALAFVPFMFSIFFAVVVPRDNLEFYITAILMPIFFFGAFLFPAATAILIYGLVFRFGRTEIRCLNESLSVRSGWGLFRWTTRLPIAKLRGFRVQAGLHHGAAPVSQNQKPVEPTLQNVGTLLADYAIGPSRIICTGYAPDWLTGLAHELTRRCTTQVNQAEPLLPVTQGSQDPSVITQRTEQPSNSDARVVVQGDTLIIEHPAKGFWRGVPGFFKTFGIFWNGFMVMWTLVFIPALFAGEVKWNDGPEKTSIWFGLLFCTPFYLIGFGFLVYFYAASIYAARWTVGADDLELWERTLFGERTQSWARNELSSIQVVTRQNNDEDKTWTTFLQIATSTDKSTEHFSDRDKAELEWLATTLSKALGL